MSATATLSSGQAATASTQLDRIFESYAGPAFTIRFWDGSAWISHDANATFGICLRTEDAWRALCESPDDVALGAKYIDGDIEVEGNLYLALRALPLLESAISHAIPAPVQKFPQHTSAFPSCTAWLTREEFIRCSGTRHPSHITMTSLRSFSRCF